MKKLFALLLAMVMVFSLAATAFADENDPPEESTAPEETTAPTEPITPGSITVNGVTAGVKYEIYKLLDLESYSLTAGAYSYKVNPAWAAYFATAEALEYFAIDDAGYVTWKAGEDDATVAGFAKKALAYAQKNGIDPVESSENEGDFAVTGTTGKFTDLTLGYYLLDSTAGALCGLTTTNPDASINAKNGTPTVDKQVQEDLTGMWGDTNTADIGQLVNFMTIIHAAAGAENYVMHDQMSDGLTFEHDLTKNPKRGVTAIQYITSEGVERTLEEGTDYTVKTGTACTDGCDFEVVFSDDFDKNLKANERLIIYYNAMLNRYAVTDDTTGNTNESFLEYGEDRFTTHDQTKTYTFSLDIIKTDSGNKLLDGASFRIYDVLVGGNEIKVVPLKQADDKTLILDDYGNPMYRRARADEDGVDIVVKDGRVTVIGFDNGIYYLEETKAPDGFNKLTARKEFTIADGNLDATFNDGIYSTGSGVHVVNKTGSMLPETGAMGTTMFIVFGMFAMVATGVLLVTKKRMSMIED